MAGSQDALIHRGHDNFKPPRVDKQDAPDRKRGPKSSSDGRNANGSSPLQRRTNISFGCSAASILLQAGGELAFFLLAGVLQSLHFLDHEVHPLPSLQLHLLSTCDCPPLLKGSHICAKRPGHFRHCSYLRFLMIFFHWARSSKQDCEASSSLPLLTYSWAWRTHKWFLPWREATLAGFVGERQRRRWCVCRIRL